MGTGNLYAAMTTPGADDADHPANSPVMHVALSARLGLDPSEMAMYRSDMFPVGETSPMLSEACSALRVACVCYTHNLSCPALYCTIWRSGDDSPASA